MDNKLADKTVNVATECAEKDWYSIDELARLSGYSVNALTNGKDGILYKNLSIEVDHETHFGGYHNTQKFYSSNVLKALEVYKRQAVVNQGNRSVEQKAEIGEELSIGFLAKTVMESGDEKSAQEFCRLVMHNTQETKRARELELQVQEQKPKVEYFDKICDSTNLTEIQTVGKNTVGAKILFKILLADKVIYQKFNDGIKYYLPYKEYEKYFESIQVPFEINGIKKTRYKLMFNAKGVIWATKKYKEFA